MILDPEWLRRKITRRGGGGEYSARAEDLVVELGGVY